MGEEIVMERAKEQEVFGNRSVGGVDNRARRFDPIKPTPSF